MTVVNVTAVTNAIAVTGDGSSAVVTIATQGPQGPAGAAGLIVDQSAKVDLSVIYYDASAATFKANATWTTTTLSDGGNF